MSRVRVCLSCYQPLDKSAQLYHAGCSRKIFGKSNPPVLPYHLGELDALARNIIQRSVTVPGVQAKLSLHFAERGNESGRLTLVGLWGNYILKPPVQRYPEMPETEDLTMHLARFFKIETVPHALIPLQSGELAYITRRIDRNRKSVRLHMEDMCQLSGRLTEDKYKGSMEQIAKIIMKYSSNPFLDVIRFFEMTLFCFLTGNADMHLKNFSLIYNEEGRIDLAPAYDMLATRLLIPAKDDPEELALSLNGKKSKFNDTDFIVFANQIGLNEKQYQNSMRRFSKGLNPALSFIDNSMLSTGKQRELKDMMLERAKRMGLTGQDLE